MFDWKSLVSTIAPVIGTALGGPVAGVAIKSLSNTLLGHEGGTEKEISTALENASPETLLALKKADQNFEIQMAELGVDLEKIAQKDRASARDMQTKNKSWIVPILAGVTVAGFFGVVFWVLSGEVSLDSTILGFVLGQVSSKAEQVYNFFFGSSVGSKEKTEKMQIAK